MQPAPQISIVRKLNFYIILNFLYLPYKMMVGNVMWNEAVVGNYS